MTETDSRGAIGRNRRIPIERWYPRLMKAACSRMPKLVMSRCSAEDFVQDTLLIGLVHWSKTDGRNENEITAWLMLILRNRIRMEIRKSIVVRGDTVSTRIRNCGQDYLESICENRHDVDGTNRLAETLEELRLQIESLPEDMRQVVCWRHYEYRDFEWIGERLQISSRQARRRHKKALERLLSNCTLPGPVVEPN